LPHFDILLLWVFVLTYFVTFGPFQPLSSVWAFVLTFFGLCILPCLPVLKGTAFVSTFFDRLGFCFNLFGSFSFQPFKP